MPNIFCESESPLLLDEVSIIMKHLNREEHQQIINLMQNSESLNEIYKCCDSIIVEHSLNNEKQNIETHIKNLFENGSTVSVLLPTKVTIGRCCATTEFNLYSFLCKLCDKYKELYIFKKDLLSKWEKVLFMLLVEEVYQNIIDNPETETNIRIAAANNLITFWEYRDCSQNISFAKNIFELWKSRRTIVPVFGTMLGTFELMQLSSLLSIQWHNFLQAYSKNREMLQCLEEFIFGLTFSQVQKIRTFMCGKNIFTIDDQDIQILLESPKPISVTPDEDPRQMYSFYRERSARANLRTATGESGPQNTIEELFMIYLLSEKLNGQTHNNIVY